MGRPKKNEEDKIVYQRVGIRKDTTYKNLKKIIKEKDFKTISDVIDFALEKAKLT